MRWTAHIEGGPRRVNHAAVPIGDRIFSFGGFCTGDNYREQRPIDVFILNTSTFRWTQVKNQQNSRQQRPSSRPPPHLNLKNLLVDGGEAPEEPEDFMWPFQRYGHTVVAYGEDIYLFGGRNDQRSCNTLYRFDTSTFRWSKPRVSGVIPGERDGHSACVIDKYMFVFGGYEDAIDRFAQDVFRLDLETFQWKLMKCKGDAPIHRDFHSATAVGKNMYIFGGRSTIPGFANGNHGSDVYSNKVCYLDTTTYTWHFPVISTPAPIGRRSHSALSIDTRILIFGGFNSRKGEHKNDLWSFDTDAMAWTELHPPGKPPIPRRRQAMCHVSNKIFLFGGTSPYLGPPLYFTPEQLSWLPPQHQQEDENSGLMDHSDLHVLDLSPSLKTLCIMQILKYDLNNQMLPQTVLEEIKNMCDRDVISKPLITVNSLTSG